jgi:uncharacterized protein DUF3124
MTGTIAMTRLSLVLTALLFIASPAHTQPAPPSPLAQFSDALTDLPSGPAIVRGRIFVPAHSSLVVGDGKDRLDLSVTLSIQNTSEKGSLVIERVDYYNVAGKPVDKYLPRAIALKPYGAVQIVVPQLDIRGGVGANFIVDWSSSDAIDEPLVEAIMIGTRGTLGHSFVSTGRKVNRP